MGLSTKEEPKDEEDTKTEPKDLDVQGDDGDRAKEDAYGGGEDEVEYGAAEDEDEPAAKKRKVEVSKVEGVVDVTDEPAKKEEIEVKKLKEDVKEELKDVLSSAVKAKAEDDSARREDEEFGQLPETPFTLEKAVETFTAALLQNGAKTPTHMYKILDGYEKVFLKLKPKDEDDAHALCRTIIKMVFSYWRLSGQRLEITIDGMLARGIVTSRAVVEHALSDRTPGAADSVSAWNLINACARKALERTQSVRSDLAVAKKLEQTELLEKSRKELDASIHETAELFTLIFTGLVRNHQDFEDKDLPLRHITLQRILIIGRKYGAFIKPLIDAAESRIPGVAHNPEIAATFQSLKAL